MKSIIERNLIERLQVTYIEGCKGPLFCLSASGMQPGVSSPNYDFGEPGVDVKTAICDDDHFVLFVPPFAEEVNLCRRFHSLIRSQLAKAGAICVMPDLFGTGDSAGLLHEADYETWLQDLHAVIRHFCCHQSNGGGRPRLSVVATRAGCLLAADLLLALDHLGGKPVIENIVFVQPEKSGKDVISRLFRARIMTQRLAGNRSENTESLWAAIGRGLSVHAGGNTLSPELCLSMSTRRLDDFFPSKLARVQTLFKLYIPGLDDSRIVGQKADVQELPTWKVYEHVTPPFWQTYEVEPDHLLVEAVVQAAVQLA